MTTEKKIIITDIIVLVVIITCLLIILSIGVVSIQKLKSLQKLRPVFKYLFHISWIISSIGLMLFITEMSWQIYKHNSYSPLIEFGIVCANALPLVLLLLLLCRLNFIFKGSMYSISKTIKCVLGTLYCFVMIAYVLLFVGVFILWVGAIGIMQISYILLSPIYIFTTIITIIIFSKQLMKLTNQRIPSVNIGCDEQNIDNPELNMHQIKMIENATRYVSLLTLGIFSSFCVFIFIIIMFRQAGSRHFYIYYRISYIIISIDCVINVVCAYSQYSFATKQYERYCKGLHLFWRYVLTRQATNKLVKRYKKALENNKNAMNNADQIELIIGDNQ
eukprot:512300_1